MPIVSTNTIHIFSHQVSGTKRRSATKFCHTLLTQLTIYTSFEILQFDRRRRVFLSQLKPSNVLHIAKNGSKDIMSIIEIHLNTDFALVTCVIQYLQLLSFFARYYVDILISLSFVSTLSGGL